MKTSIPKLHKIKFKDGIFADNVVTSHNWHVGNIRPLDVLKGAANANMNEVVLIGYDGDNQEYIASSVGIDRTAYLFGRGLLQMLRYED